MPRKVFICGNWKCNPKSSNDVATLVKGLNAYGSFKGTDVCVAPTSLHLAGVKSTLRKDILIAGQNCSRTGPGAYTGEVSAAQLNDLSIGWVILGHSERRTLYKESEAVIGEKVAIALKAGLNVIPCVGETLEQRESGKVMEVIAGQLRTIVDAVTDWSRVVLAYEPVWAIGTGKVATPQQAQETQAQIRQWLAANVSQEVARNVRICYGGSVKPSNAAQLISEADIDGFLIGGASLKAKDFGQIITAVQAPRAKL